MSRPGARLLPACWLLAMALADDPAATASAASGREPDGEEDRRHMARLARGDTAALRPIFDRWKLPLLSYLYRALGSHADAEDLALQTFVRVHRHAARYDPARPFATWLFAIARHELLHELRRRRRKPVEPVAPGDLDYGADPNPFPGAASGRSLAELEEQLLLALQHLPERQRSALLLAAAGDLSHRDIAGSLGVTENHLRVILHRARQALRQHFPPAP